MPNELTRKSQFAGSFYPKDPQELKNNINSYLDKISLDENYNSKEIFGIIAPHAGYVYSANTAAYSYKSIQNNKFDLAVILAPSHQKYFKGASIFNGDFYETPLGKSNIDKDFASSLSKYKDLNLSNVAHINDGNNAEHSLEVQLPFLQVVQANLPIVPIIIGSQDYSTIHSTVFALYNTIKQTNKKVLFIASTDLSHFHNLEEANKLDNSLIKSFENFDYFKIELNALSNNWEACGAAPLIITMQICELLGANKCLLFDYSTSADSKYSNYDKNRVVGYFSGGIYKSDEVSSELLPNINKQDKSNILNFAKNSVEEFVRKKTIKNNYSYSNIIKNEYPTFVTINKLNKNNEYDLRACMGHIISSQELLNEIKSTAQLAASEDYRFGPIKISELDSLKYEVTILSRFKKINDINSIEIGKNGIYLRNENKSALFLPQVASDNNWDRIKFLENLCYKARLPKEAYIYPETELYIFEAVIID